MAPLPLRRGITLHAYADTHTINHPHTAAYAHGPLTCCRGYYSWGVIIVIALLVFPTRKTRMPVRSLIQWAEGSVGRARGIAGAMAMERAATGE